MIRTAASIARTAAGQSVLQTTSKSAPVCNLQQVRSTVVVERMYKPRLAKKGEMPKLKNRNMVYRLVENVRNSPTPDIECILLDYVEGVGAKGAVAKVKRTMFRNHLLPAGLAVYNTPDNLAEYASSSTSQENVGVTAFAKLTQQQLSTLSLRVPMSGDNSWTLNKTHLRVAFRKMGVELHESCLELPEEPVTGPGKMEVTVKINKVLTVNVKAIVYQVFKDPAKNELPPFPRVYQPSVRRHRGEHSEESQAVS